MKKECVAMLLAGGQGSRLYVLTGDMAKPAVPFGGKFRIIDFPLSNCTNSGIDTVGVLTQYRPLELNSYIGSGQPWELDRLNGHSTVASKAMCTFLIITISSLQLIPVNMIAYRSQYGSRVPMAIVGPALVITLATTLVAVGFCLGKQWQEMKKRGIQRRRGKQEEETCERRVQNIKIPERELRIDGTPGGGRL